MNNTPASNETRLGLLDHEELNIREAFCLEQTWKFLLDNKEAKFDSLLVNQAHKFGFNHFIKLITGLNIGLSGYTLMQIQMGELVGCYRILYF